MQEAENGNMSWGQESTSSCPIGLGRFDVVETSLRNEKGGRNTLIEGSKLVATFTKVFMLPNQHRVWTADTPPAAMFGHFKNKS